MKAITARQVTTVGRGRHRVAGTPGLFLEVRASGARAWVARLWNGRRETMRGLGSVCDVTLTDAKRETLTLRAAIVTGADVPKRKARTAAAPIHTWEDTFDRLTARKADSVRDSTLRAMRSVWRQHMAPVLGARDVSATTREDVVNLIAGIDGSSAFKVRRLAREVGALAVSLGWAAVNPAGKEIDTALPATAKRRGEGRRRAMPHTMIGEWLRGLAAGVVTDAIRMLVFTGARLADVHGAEWSEIDGDVWTVPGARHKTGRDFRIPLTAPALAVLDNQRGHDARYIFPSPRVAGRPLSGATTRKAMHVDYDLHGFRAALSTWASETGQPRDLTETALSHAVGTAVERAYQRSDLFDRRRDMMSAWAAHVAG